LGSHEQFVLEKSRLLVWIGGLEGEVVQRSLETHDLLGVDVFFVIIQVYETYKEVIIGGGVVRERLIVMLEDLR
jgi:hypothetical protein